MAKLHRIKNKQRLIEIFKEPPLILYGKGKSLKDLLVRACNITHANLNTKKVVSACKSFVYPIRFGNEMEKTEKQTCIKCSPFESNERRLQSRFSKLATKYRFNRLKSKSRKDDGREKCPLQDDPHPPKSAFYLSLFLRKRTYRPFNSRHINKKQEEIK